MRVLLLLIVLCLVAFSPLQAGATDAEGNGKGKKKSPSKEEATVEESDDDFDVLIARCCSDDEGGEDNDDTDCSEIDCSKQVKKVAILKHILAEGHKSMSPTQHLAGEHHIHLAELNKRIDREVAALKAASGKTPSLLEVMRLSSGSKADVENPSGPPHHKGVVKYKFAEKKKGWWLFGNAHHHARMVKAMADWEKDTCVVFLQDNSARVTYEETMVGSSSFVGADCRAVKVSKFSNLNTARHELGHWYVYLNLLCVRESLCVRVFQHGLTVCPFLLLSFLTFFLPTCPNLQYRSLPHEHQIECRQVRHIQQRCLCEGVCQARVCQLEDLEIRS